MRAAVPSPLHHKLSQTQASSGEVTVLINPAVSAHLVLLQCQGIAYAFSELILSDLQGKVSVQSRAETGFLSSNANSL